MSFHTLHTQPHNNDETEFILHRIWTKAEDPLLQCTYGSYFLQIVFERNFPMGMGKWWDGWLLPRHKVRLCCVIWDVVCLGMCVSIIRL